MTDLVFHKQVEKACEHSARFQPTDCLTPRPPRTNFISYLYVQLNFLQGRECRLPVKSQELQNPDTAHFAIFNLSPLFLKYEKMLLKVQADSLVCYFLSFNWDCHL